MNDIAVVGPGAIGTTVAASLHEAGRTPLLCGRTPRERLDLDTDDGRITVPGPVLTDPTLITEPADAVLLAVKATQIDASAGWLGALCGPGTVVCVLQNGVEQVAMVGPLARGARVIPSVVWFPAQRQPDGSVWLRGQPRLTCPPARQQTSSPPSWRARGAQSSRSRTSPRRPGSNSSRTQWPA